MDHNSDTATLFYLDGVEIEQKYGYWVKFKVRWANEITEEIPHGIRYSLTLHDRYGDRVMGFDNAHGIHKKYKAFDHQHRYKNDKGISYRFVNAYQLLKDFWKAVDETLNEIEITQEDREYETH